MAGDPDLRRTEAFARACEQGGADVIELGIPFSDPIADGPEIQRAGQRSLRSGTRTRDVLGLVTSLRRRSEIPLILMSYANPIYAMGLEPFVEQAQEAGVDGVIVPDLSWEDSDEVSGALDRRGLDGIQLVAPSTPVERAAAIAESSRGFLYVVSRFGTTGARPDLSNDLAARISDLHRVTDLPLVVGFGVTTAAHVRALAGAGADGVVVGSAIVRRIGEDAKPEAIARFVAELTSSLPS
jgi:tryptophan synthase alpha chain